MIWYRFIVTEEGGIVNARAHKQKVQQYSRRDLYCVCAGQAKCICRRKRGWPDPESTVDTSLPQRRIARSGARKRGVLDFGWRIVGQEIDMRWFVMTTEKPPSARWSRQGQGRYGAWTLPTKSEFRHCLAVRANAMEPVLAETSSSALAEARRRPGQSRSGLIPLVQARPPDPTGPNLETPGSA